MIEFRPEGIYCVPAGIYIDPWKPVARAVITHAHSDHARPGHRYYLCQTESRDLLRLRLGEDIAVQTLDYNESLMINGVQLSLHPAGHMTGAAQVRLEYKGEVWCLSGDYKLSDDGLSTPYEAVRCHSFLTESTFGLPVYHFPDPAQVHTRINDWWRQNSAEGFNSLLIAYAMGKSQHILRHLDTGIGPVYLHGATANVTDRFRAMGYALPGSYLDQSVRLKQAPGAMILAPNSVIGSPWLKRLQPYRMAICSGWMQLRGPRRRQGADQGFVLSDHCDFAQLNAAITATGASRVYVTHGYEELYARWLQERYALEAIAVKTLFGNDQDMDTEIPEL